MNQFFLMITCLSIFMLTASVVNGQTTYQPGNTLRVNFEGKHRMATRTIQSTTYQPGTILRIDFQGTHKNIDRSRIPTSTYNPGAVLRIDFEGRHRKNR